jgi:hypothetical protein
MITIHNFIVEIKYFVKKLIFIHFFQKKVTGLTETFLFTICLN